MLFLILVFLFFKDTLSVCTKLPSSQLFSSEYVDCSTVIVGLGDECGACVEENTCGETFGKTTVCADDYACVGGTCVEPNKVDPNRIIGETCFFTDNQTCCLSGTSRCENVDCADNLCQYSGQVEVKFVNETTVNNTCYYTEDESYDYCNDYSNCYENQCVFSINMTSIEGDYCDGYDYEMPEAVTWGLTQCEPPLMCINNKCTNYTFVTRSLGETCNKINDQGDLELCRTDVANLYCLNGICQTPFTKLKYEACDSSDTCEYGSTCAANNVGNTVCVPQGEVVIGQLNSIVEQTTQGAVCGWVMNYSQYFGCSVDNVCVENECQPITHTRSDTCKNFNERCSDDMYCNADKECVERESVAFLILCIILPFICTYLTWVLYKWYLNVKNKPLKPEVLERLSKIEGWGRVDIAEIVKKEKSVQNSVQSSL